jgi:uncharacterized peroxidase-related enzyme
MPYIEIIEHDEAEGELLKAYNDLIRKRGKLASIHKIHSLNPEAMMKHMDLYMTLLYGKSPLKRIQREMIGTAVSIANDCDYCQQHHSTAMNHYWKDDARIQLFLNDYKTAGLTELEEALCQFAITHTKNPGSDKKEQIVRLKELGLEDRAILDTTLIIAYFNFVNRIVIGLGVATEAEGVDGFKFD